MKIRNKFFLFLFLLVLIIAGSNVLVIGLTLNKKLTDELLDRMVVNTQSAVDSVTNLILTKDTAGVVNFVFNEKYSRKDLAYILVIDENDTVVASTLINENLDTVLSGNTLPRGENKNISLIKDFRDGQVYDVAVPLGYNKGTLRAGYLKGQIDELIQGIVFLILVASAMSLFVALLLAIFFSRMIFNPLTILNTTVSKVAEGDLSQRAVVSSGDEIGNFAKVFNQMLDNVEKSQQDLRRSEKHLESLVEERTKEMEKKVHELEKFQSMTIGRELKMIDLKKKIKGLQKEGEGNSVI